MGILQAAPVQALVDAKAICCWCGETLKRAKQLNVWSPWWCFTKACYERQCAWSVTAEKKGRPTEWLFCPVPKQVEFFEEAYRLGRLALEDPERGSGRVLFGGAAGPGKAVALDTIIPTPTGLTTMAALAIGDVVLDEHGAICRVVAKSEVHVDPQGTYRLTFDDDGAIVIAGASHEWVTWTDQERAQHQLAPVVGATRMTADIASTVLAGTRVNHAVLLTGQRWRYITACQRIADVPVQCITVDSPSHQYLVTAYGIPTHNSHALRWGLYRDAMRIPDLNCLLLRRTFKELDATHLREMMREVPRLGGRYLTADKRAVWPNGSVIQAGHCETDTDAGNHLSTEYDREVFDELVTFAMEPALEIMSRARTAKDAVKAAGGAQVWAGSNPGGRGALWVKAFFVDKSVDPAQFPRYQPERYSYVHARLEDNPYMDPAYRQTLEEMPTLRRRQLLEGDWNAFSGQFFDYLAMKEGAPWHEADMGVTP